MKLSSTAKRIMTRIFKSGSLHKRDLPGGDSTDKVVSDLIANGLVSHTDGYLGVTGTGYSVLQSN